MSQYEGSERRARPPVSRSQFNWVAIAILVTVGMGALGATYAYGQSDSKIQSNATNIDRLEDMIIREREGDDDTFERIETILMQQHGVLSAQTQAIETLTDEIRAARGRDGLHE